MNAAQFAEFWRIQGYRVIQTESGYWYNAHPFSFLSLPYHRLMMPARRELAQVLLKGPAAVIRFPTVSGGVRPEGGLYICSDRNYDLPSLDKKARNQTRRGLERCVIEQLDFSHLAERGHALNVETWARQGRSPQTITSPQWRHYCEAAGQIPGFEAWGARVQGSLAAFMVTALVEDCFGILHQSSATEYLEHYPNNALVFTAVKRKLSDPHVGYVSYGLKSVDDTDGLGHFKLQMGFELVPFHESIILHPFSNF